MLFDLTGKTAVVTGGSRGIGLMAARGLVGAGARVCIVSRDEQACADAVRELTPYGDVTAIAADLGTPEGCSRFAEQLIDSNAKLDILVNNAGAAWGAPLEAYPVTGWDKVMNLNVRAPFLLIQSLVPLLERSGTADDPARIINVGSIDGLRVPQMQTFAYSASKAAIHHLTRVLAVELGPRRITVNAVAPGPFESKMMAATLDEIQFELEAVAPLRRIGRPDDIAGVMVYLASPASSFVTGVTLPVDGGISLLSQG